MADSVKGLLIEMKILLPWYSGLVPTHMDLIGDFAGSELFMIEGDSLLRNAFNDTRIEMKASGGGFQILHAVYVVEKFLSELKKRKCRFHVLFFDAHQPLCVPEWVQEPEASLYLLARGCIIRHLIANTPSGAHDGTQDINILRFRSPADSGFSTYLADHRPYFVMTHDGGAIKSGGGLQYLHCLAFRAFIFDMMNRGFAIGLIHEIEFRDSKAVSMIMTGSNMDKARGILPWIPELMDLLNKQRPCATLKAGHMRPLEELSDTILGHVSQDNGSGSNSEWPSERTLLHLLSLSRLLQNPRKTHLHKFVAPLLLHTSLLKHLGLKQRRFPHVSFDKTTESEYKEFVLSIVITQYPYLNEFDGEYTRLLERKTLPCDVHDLFDGRLFRVVLYTVNSSRFSQSPFIPVHVERTLNILLSQLQSLCDGTSSSFAISRHGFGLKVQPTLRNICYPPQFLTVLPFSHPVFDHHFSVIKLEEDNNILQQFSGGYGAIFEKPLYSTHWHTIRPLVEKKGTVTVMKNKWALRAEQMQNLHKHKFASSLTGSAGNELTPERIYTTTASSGKRGKDSGSDRRQNMPAQASGQKGAKVDKKVGKKGVQVSKAEEIKRANALAKAGDRLKKAALAWKTFRSQYLESIPDLREKIAALDKLIPKCTESSIQLEVKLYRTRLLFKLWTLEYCMPDSVDRAGGYGLVALIFNDVRHLLSDPSLTKPMKTTVDRLWSALGFKQLQSLSITERSLPDTPFHDPTAFKDSAQDSIDTSTHIDLIEFQLKYCGPYMDRTLGSRDDSRVGFKPDAWQVNVLDAIDEDKSVFVVAPTSSGKTFIAFYAMEKVLKADDEGVLVYVAPTKALVNQIAAEVQARFSKRYKYPGKTVWSIHTRDYRINNPTNCQILITVPHILQIMLLSPSNAETWSPRVKRIILDEIHCIGQEDGAVWEQLVLLAPCPIIALSATVGNPKEFHEWLQLTQRQLKWASGKEEQEGVEVVMVEQTHRFNDLRKFQYIAGESSESLSNSSRVKGLAGTPVFPGLQHPRLMLANEMHFEDTDFKRIHPIATLGSAAGIIPTDLALESRDCFTLFQAMNRYQNEKFPLSSSLHYSKFFTDVIGKRHVNEWEAELKGTLQGWMNAQDSPFIKVVNELQGRKVGAVAMGQDARLNAAQSSFVDSEGSEEGEASDSEDTGELESGSRQERETQADLRQIDEDQTALFDSTLRMVHDLNSKNALPAILFSYDRQMCNDLCRYMYYKLVEGERYWRKNSPEWKQKLRAREAWLKRKAIQDAQAAKVISKKKGSLKGKDIDGLNHAFLTGVEDAPAIASFDPNQPNDEFSFAAKGAYSTEELQQDFEILAKAGVDRDFRMAVRRGIGIHHAGLNRKLRECVERLFRKGFLRVVIATGTLSLGINMPCTTVCFVGDSVYLTPLNFRQASGRAGRRGFDLVGNVVFQGLPLSRIHKLMNSRLPALVGHFPTSTTLILRLFILLHGTGGSSYAKEAIDRLLSQSRLSLGGQSFREQILHQVRFSIEYLRRQNLLSAKGVPINFAACAAHLYYTEPSNFAFHVLLRAGIFHSICQRVSRDAHVDDPPIREDTNRKLILVLAHVFGRRPFRKADHEKIDDWAKSASSSSVLLPELPEDAIEALENHEQETLENFSRYVLTFAQSHRERLLEAEDRLPYTNYKINDATGCNDRNLASGQSHDEGEVPFLPMCPPVIARSPFVALSGYSDNFAHIADLTETCRDEIAIGKSGIPHLQLDHSVKLNAYLLDFYTHGSVTELVRANRIRRGDIWYWLNDFSMVLATIVTAMTNLVDGSVGNKEFDSSMLDVMGSGDLQELEKEGGFEIDDANKSTSEDGSGRLDEGEGYDEDRVALIKVLNGFKNLQEDFNKKFKDISATKSFKPRYALRKPQKPRLRGV